MGMLTGVLPLWATEAGFSGQSSPAPTGSGMQQAAAGSTPLIVRPIDDTQLVELPGNVHPATRKAVDQGAAAENLSLQRMMLVLKRSDAQQTALQTFLDQQQNPKSTNFHHWLSPEQFGAKFGVAHGDQVKIEGWLSSHGFTVESVGKGGNLLIFSGTNAQLRSAFHTEIHSYKMAGSTYYANAANPKIPEALAPVVAGVAKLNSFPIQPQHAMLGAITRSGKNGKWKPASSSPGSHPLFNTTISGTDFYAVSPLDFAAIYNVKSLWDADIDGTGQTIAVLGRSDIVKSDIDAFRSYFGLPETKLNVIYDGANPGLLVGDEGESDLDIEWSGAIAKNATIDFVVAGSTRTSDGVMLAAEYAIDNNIAPVVSLSYGECELGLGTAGNQLIAELWEQAAAEGITVVVASGDGGSAACDQNAAFANYGLAVNGLSSTAYDVAVGGTDLYGTYLNASAYWNTSNDPTTKQSAKSYMPELPWNNSCGNPQLLAAYQQAGITDTTEEALCNDFSVLDNVANTSAGGGGPSSCTVSSSADPTTCSGGYAKPAWQAGVPGASDDSVRDVPDVSLFAGSGLWGSFSVFCESDLTSDGKCNFDSSDDVQYLAGGGTSFAAPAFAGIMALVNQKTGTAQGNANYSLYKLASTQYQAATACDSSTASGGNACLFYDISLGSNAVPCLSGSVGCTLTNPSADFLGVLPGWDGKSGYDAATGLGSVNAYNLVDQWSTAASSFTATTTTLTLESTAYSYGTQITGSIAVSAEGGGSGTPTGDTSVTNASGATTIGLGPYALRGGQAAVSASGLPAGSYTLTGRYAGDATYAASTSDPVTLTINKAATTSSLSASRASLTTGESVTLTAAIETASTASSPTGTVVFTDSSTNTVLGSVALVGGLDGSGNAIARASLNVAGQLLNQGDNVIQASYTGDRNYSAPSVASTTVSYVPPFSLSVNPSSIVLNADGSTTATVQVTANNGPLAAPVVLSCGAPVPAGLSCAFSPSGIAAGVTSATATLTLNAVSPLLKTKGNFAKARRSIQAGAGGVAVLAFAGLLILPGGRKRVRTVSSLLLVCMVGLMTNCGGSGPAATIVGLTATPTTGPTGTKFTFQASVTPVRGHGVPTGTVTFIDSNSVLGEVALNGSTASYSTTSLNLGKHSISATYSGDTKNQASSSTAAAVVDVQSAVTLSIIAADTAGNTVIATVPVTVQ